MNVSVKPGKYVLAVSGGVDSMVLLHVLAQQDSLDLVVAHFDHGIRPDSAADRQLVAEAAKRYGLPFRSAEGHLGPMASEEQARRARYTFLRRVMQAEAAKAIITAHHQDDVLETAVINMLRGTGRKGISSLVSTNTLLRPLLHLSKQQIRQLAADIQRHNPAFTWHEDSTNQSDHYLRNYVRHHMLSRLKPEQRRLLLEYTRKAAVHNPVIDGLLLQVMDNAADPATLSRYRFIMLPYDVSSEVMAAWLRQNGLRDFDRKAISRLVVAAKVGRPGKRIDIKAGYFLKTGKTVLQIIRGSLS